MLLELIVPNNFDFMIILLQYMMQKRLRYAMPRKPLSEYKAQNHQEGEDGIPLEDVAEAQVTNVGVMAKRIHEMEMKKRQLYQPPAMGPLGGDLSDSESDESEMDPAEEP